MIIWLASYPKSGNTWVRAFLASYLYANSSETLFEKMSKIRAFPKKNYFEGIVKEEDIKKNPMIIFKYFIEAQKKYNQNKSLKIIKTHNFWGSIDGFDFSNLENTYGGIYIVRDPRSVAVSYAHHAKLSLEESVDALLNENRLGTNNEFYYEARSSWKSHYLSWMGSPAPKILIKYEDLIEEPFEQFKKILEFINKFLNKKIIIDDEKINKSINESSFDNLSKLEENRPFPEKLNDVKFFRKGLSEEWKKVLNPELAKKIEVSFIDEMKQLNYI
tara:strand:- start:758 stop:1579 length:822 start_codon:yes stop_codon:yes gene_type:complete